MSADRLPAELEASALMRRVATTGGFAAVIQKGDPDRGSLLLVIASRGRHFGCLERVLDAGGGYLWQKVGPDESAGSAQIADFLARRTRFDPDLWIIELDIALPEQFIAETSELG